MSVSVKNVGGNGGSINIKNGIIQEAKSIDGDIPPGMFIQEDFNVKNLSSGNQADMTLLSDPRMGELHCEVPNSNIILLARQDEYNGTAYTGRNIDIVRVNSDGSTELLGTHNVSDTNESDNTYKLGHIQGMFIIDNYIAVYGNGYSSNKEMSIVVFQLDVNSNGTGATLLPVNKTDLLVSDISDAQTGRQIRNFRLCLNREDNRTIFGCMRTYYSTGGSNRDYPVVLRFNEDYSVSIVFKTTTDELNGTYYMSSPEYYDIHSIDNSWMLITRQDAVTSGYYHFKFTKVTLDTVNNKVVYNDSYYEFSDKDNNKNQSISVFTNHISMKIVFNDTYNIMYLLGQRAPNGTVAANTPPSISKYVIKDDGKMQLEMWSLCQTYEASGFSIDVSSLVLIDTDTLAYITESASYGSVAGFMAMRMKIMAMRPNGVTNVYPSISNNVRGYAINQYRSSSDTSYLSSTAIIKTSFSNVLLYAYQRGQYNGGLSKAIRADLAIKPSTTTVDGVTKTKCTTDVAGKYWIPSYNQAEAFAAVEAYNSEITDRAINTVKANVIAEMEVEPNVDTEPEIVD